MCRSILTLLSPPSQEAALRDYGLGEFSASASIPEERRETDSPNVSNHPPVFAGLIDVEMMM
jgi:hypothetical protein